MKRYLLLFLGLIFSFLAQSQTIISGKVAPQRDTSLGVFQVLVKAYEVGNPTNIYSSSYTDASGYYSLSIGAGVTEAVISLTDRCGNIYEDTLTLNGGNMTYNFVVACPFIDKESMVQVSGRVVDDDGNPLPNEPVNVTIFSSNGSFSDYIYTNMGGYFYYENFYDYVMNGDSAIEFSVRDYCSNEYTKHVSLERDSNKIVTANLSFEVSCGPKNLIYVEGSVTDGNDKVWTKAGVKAQYRFDRYKQIYVNTDTAGNFYIALPKSITSGDRLILTLADSTGHNISDTIQLEDGQTTYSYDFVVTTKPYTAFILNGIAYTATDMARGVIMKAYYQNSPDIFGEGRTDVSGSFNIAFLAPDYGAGFDSVVVYAASCPSDTVKILYEGNPVINDIYVNNVQCSNDNLPNEVTFTINVFDHQGNPVNDATVFVSMSYDTYDIINQTYQGVGTLSLPIPKDTTYFRFGVEDLGHNVYDTIVMFDFSKFDFADTFYVDVSEPIIATVEGHIYGNNDIPMSGAVIRAYLPEDVESDTLFVRADKNGYYKITAEAPPDGALVAFLITDSCGNTALDTFRFYIDTPHVTRDIHVNNLTCPYTNANPFVRISGVVYDQQNQPAPYVLVSAMFLNTPYDPDNYTDGRFYGVTDQNGFYTIKMNLPMQKDTIVVEIFDSCTNYYSQNIWFDYNTFVYNNIDFTGDDAILCPPSTPQPVNASMTIGMDQNPENPLNYYFYAYLITNLGYDVYPSYFIWHIGNDTVVTTDASLSYTFEQVDTCINVWVEAVFSNNYLVASPQMKVCVQNLFDYLGGKCYADFVASTFDNTGMNFEFYPFILADTGLYPVQVVWDFGDTQTLTLNSNFDTVVTHTYSQPGAYDVTLTVDFTNYDGTETCQAVWTEPVWAGSDVWYPQDSCAAAFYVTEDPDTPLKVYFQDISYPGQYSNIEYYYWDFGDSTTSTAPSPTHIYPTAGDYTVYMEIITNSMCYSNFTLDIPVGQNLLPILFYPDSVGNNTKTAGYGVKFYNISKTNSDKWTWDFGEEEKGSLLKTTDSVVIHYYADTGYYNVTLTDLNTGAGMTMRIHVTGDSSVVPLWAVLVASGPITNVEQPVNIDMLSVYPNPASDVLYVNLDHSATSGLIDVYTLTGRLVKRMVITNMQNVRLDVKDLAPGSYLIKAAYDGKVGIAKFVKR